MVRGCKLSGVKKIRIHDLRHSHASLLIELGFAPLLISERLGHENVETTIVRSKNQARRNANIYAIFRACFLCLLAIYEQ